MKLEGPKIQELIDALSDAYPNPTSLVMMLDIQLGKKLYNLVPPNNDLTTIIYDLITEARSGGWHEELVFKAHEYKPGNELLKMFYQKYKSANTVPVPEIPQADTDEKANQIQSLPTAQGTSPYELQSSLPQGSPQQSFTQQSSIEESVIERTFATGTIEQSDQDLHSTSSTSNSTILTSTEVLEVVQGQITNAQKCVEGASVLLKGGKNVTPIKLKKALQLVNTANTYMQNLRELLDNTIPLPQEIVLSHQELIDKIYIITGQIEILANQINKSISSTGDAYSLLKDFPYYFTGLIKLFNEMGRLILSNEIPS